MQPAALLAHATSRRTVTSVAPVSSAMAGVGRLVVVATPIGNLGDLSPRAAEALAHADLLACEDTRRTGRLLDLSGIKAPKMVVVNDHSEHGEVARLVEAVAGGQVVVLVSDAGTPAISDPGQRLVAAVVAASLPVVVVPGPSAAVAALVVSGLPTDRWVFEGFLPRKGGERAQRLAEVAAERRTTILYEAPHRVERTVADLAEACGPDRRVALARELTKLHEEVWRGSLSGAAAWFEQQPPRGEFVVVLEGAPPPGDPTDADIVAALADARATGATTRDAVAQVSARLNVPKRRAYDLAVGD